METHLKKTDKMQSWGIENDPTVRFFVANPQTGGRGLTLIKATNVIYFSNDFDLEKRIQSEDRNHRSGQN